MQITRNLQEGMCSKKLGKSRELYKTTTTEKSVGYEKRNVPTKSHINIKGLEALYE